MARQSNPWIVEGQQAVADWFGVSLHTVANEWAAHGMPALAGRRGAKKRYDLRAVGRWLARVRMRAGQGIPTPGSLAERYAAARAIEMAERAALRSIARRRAEGALVPREEHERALLLRSGWFAAVLEALPARLTALTAGLAPPAARAAIEAECERLRALAFGPAGPAGPAEDAGPATEVVDGIGADRPGTERADGQAVRAGAGGAP